MSVFADIRVPEISRDELFAFHASHFANVSVAKFGVSFIGLQVPPAPVQTEPAEAVDEEFYDEYEYGEGEEEDYGDYDEPLDPSVAHLVPDFDFANAVEVGDAKPATDTNESRNITSNERNEAKNNENHDEKEDDAEDGEIPEESAGPKPKKKKRRKKKNGAGNKTGSSNTAAGSSNGTEHDKAGRRDRQGRPHKPDLRKRTWDVVDKGIGSLDYDDTETDPGCMPAPSQRRRIQYED